MDAIQEFLIRTYAFVVKEIAAIVRQPRLLAILILGPFLILLIFGLGYTNKSQDLDAIIVVPADSTIRDQIDELAERLIGINVIDIVTTKEEADDRLLNQEADLIITTPANPLEDIRSGSQSILEFHHHEIDPLEQLHVRTLERAYINEINRQALITAADKAKEEVQTLGEKLEDARIDAVALQQDLEQGDVVAAIQDLDSLNIDVQVLVYSLGNGLAAYEGVQSLGGETVSSPSSIFGNIGEIERLMGSLSQLNPEQDSYTAEAEQAAQLVSELDRIDISLDDVSGLDSRIVARPFYGKVINLAGIELGPIDFYVPGVIALLLQHMAVTMAALAIVREQRGGSLELFRAAPLSSFETLFGKSISYMILTLLIAVTLTALIVLGLSTPMLGSWADYAVVILALLFTSLSMGFAISAISETDTQAVQYSMIVLLASIFFSGFFIALQRLADGVHLVSWLLPATYGTSLLQDIMLRGLGINPTIISGLVLYGLFLFVFSWWRLRRKMQSV